MRKIIIVIMFLCLLLSLPLKADGSDTFKTGYVCYDTEGNVRWRAQTEIVKAPSGRDLYIMTEKGKGIFSGFKGEISWIEQLKFESTKDSVKPITQEKRVFDKDGKEIIIETQEFDLQKNKVIYSRKDLVSNETKEEAYKFKDDIVNRLILGLYVQKFLENQQITGKRAQMITSEPRLYTFNIKVLGAEDISINGQSRKAYKICLDPDLGLFNLLKIVVPRVYTWHLATPAYNWLQYKGVESTPASPKVHIKTQD